MPTFRDFRVSVNGTLKFQKALSCPTPSLRHPSSIFWVGSVSCVLHGCVLTGSSPTDRWTVSPACLHTSQLHVKSVASVTSLLHFLLPEIGGTLHEVAMAVGPALKSCEPLPAGLHLRKGLPVHACCGAEAVDCQACEVIVHWERLRHQLIAQHQTPALSVDMTHGITTVSAPESVTSDADAGVVLDNGDSDFDEDVQIQVTRAALRRNLMSRAEKATPVSSARPSRSPSRGTTPAVSDDLVSPRGRRPSDRPVRTPGPVVVPRSPAVTPFSESKHRNRHENSELDGWDGGVVAAACDLLNPELARPQRHRKTPARRRLTQSKVRARWLLLAECCLLGVSVMTSNLSIRFGVFLLLCGTYAVTGPPCVCSHFTRDVTASTARSATAEGQSVEANFRPEANAIVFCRKLAAGPRNPTSNRANIVSSWASILCSA
jgi:hypothetical protein